ncbi:uncharacterized protein LOC115217615 [Argonauta hians]
MKNQMLRVNLIYFPFLIIITTMQSYVSGKHCPKEFEHKEDHTACLTKSPELKESLSVSDIDKNKIVRMHNYYRSNVQPPACNMFKMYWDNELAYIAQKWADNCDPRHDDNSNRNIPLKYAVGQNIAAGYNTWENVIYAWHSEVKYYKYGDSLSKATGHYTQIVWATSILIGCALSRCSDIDTFHVCNYAPAGNTYGQNPYQFCKSRANLWDCGNNPCYNFGTLIKEDCSCNCLNYRQIAGPRCLINCSYSDPLLPCSIGPSSWCKYANVRPTCPWMCKECNHAVLSRKLSMVLFCFVQIFILVLHSN